MKIKLITLVSLMCLIGNISFAQVKFDWGAKFEFDVDNEKDVKFAMVDNYNTFLASYTDVYGMLAEHKLIIRKFDQKNQLIDTFSSDFPTFEKGAYFNYIGSADAANGKFVFYTEAYVGKTKKKEVSQTVFDKSTGTFSSSVIANYPIESAMKSGTTYFQVSPNGRFGAIRHEKYSGRKDPQTNFITVIDLQNLSTLWNKDYTFQDGFHAQHYAVSNAGNIVIIAADKATKVQDYILYGTVSGFEKKTFSTYMEAHKPAVINIGQKEYVVAFNKEVKGLMKDPYENILLFDLENGKIISNNKAIGLYSHKDIVDVAIRNIFIHNNEITIFSEGKLKAGTKEQKSPMGTMSVPTPYYHYTSSYMISMSLEGEIKNIKKLNISQDNEADLYRSFGALQINEKFFTLAGLYMGVQQLKPTEEHDKSIVPLNVSSDPFFPNVKYVNQLIIYLPDSNRFILGRTVNTNGMSLVNAYGATIR